MAFQRMSQRKNKNIPMPKMMLINNTFGFFCVFAFLYFRFLGVFTGIRNDARSTYPLLLRSKSL